LRPLELAGRDVYIAEGCYVCHSQMIRPFRWETQRYGDRSTLLDSMYDHPFQWGSKRTGPDLAREGGKNPNSWHYRHMIDPREITPGSNMPPYPHLATTPADLARIPATMSALRTVGVPYTDAQIASAGQSAQAMARAIVADLRTQRITVREDSQLVALIAYLQRLGIANPTDAPAP
jgi:cytochrome c oxidase cbb3-type subunit I/II